MSRFASLLTLAASVAIAAAPLGAQSPVAGSLTYRGDISTNGTLKSGYTESVVGPYKADLNFGSALKLENAVIWCVDWEHFTPSKGYADSYYMSALQVGADLSKTRQNSLSKYLKAAWMFEQVNPNGGTYNSAPTRYSAKNVQGTVWEMMDGSDFNPSGNMSGSNYGLNDYTSYGNTRYFNVKNDIPQNLTAANLTMDWYVLTDYRTGNESRTMNQEFLVGVARPTQVPEPASLALVVTGLGALGAAARRRRRTS